MNRSRPVDANSRVLSLADAYVYLEMIDDVANHNKFWEAHIEGVTLVTRWGRINTDGQSKVEMFKNTSAAFKSWETQTRKKMDKGYHMGAERQCGRLKQVGDTLTALRRGTG